MSSQPTYDVSDGRARLAQYIEQHGIAAALVQPAHDTPTVALAALALGCQPEQIVKSIVLLLRDADQVAPVLVIANGESQIDFRKVADLFQVGRKRIRLAPADVVLAHTGYPAGGVPPFGFPQPIPTYVDRRVFEQSVVYGGGGDDRTMLRITPTELQRATGGQIVDVR